jgi:hypothetical protein
MAKERDGSERRGELAMMPSTGDTGEVPIIVRRSPASALALGLLATALVVILLLLLAMPAATPWLEAWPRLGAALRLLFPPLLVVAWVALLARGGARRAAMAVALGAVCVAAYAQVTVPASDPAGSRRYVAAALALLGGPGNQAARPREERAPASDASAGEEAAIERAAGGVAVAILPAVWLGDHLLPTTTPAMPRWQRLGDAVADLLAALAVALLFVVAARLGARPQLAAMGAAIFAFATPHLANDAGGLWAHTVTIPLELAALALVLGEPSAGAAAWAGALGGLALAIRPSSAFISLVAAVALVARRRADHFDPWGLGGRPRLALLLWAGGFAAATALAAFWARLTFGSAMVLIPHLGLTVSSSVGVLRPWVHAVGGLLFSANRGLLVGAPVLLFAAAGGVLAIGRGRGWKRAFYVAAVVAAALYVAVEARDPEWWRTMAFGPLRLTELLPLLVLMLLPFLDWLPSTSRWSRILAAGVFLLALAGSGFVAWRGATAPGTRRWNVAPPLSEARAWDWQDLQVLRDDDQPRGLKAAKP